MNPVHCIRRSAAVLAALACAWLGLAAAAAAFAMPPPAPSTRVPAQVRTDHIVVVGGMPGRQLAMIAIGAALVAPASAVLAYQPLARRQAVTATA